MAPRVEGRCPIHAQTHFVEQAQNKHDGDAALYVDTADVGTPLHVFCGRVSEARMPPTMELVSDVIDTRPNNQLRGKGEHCQLGEDEAGRYDEGFGFTNEPDADFLEWSDDSEWCFFTGHCAIQAHGGVGEHIAIVDTGCTGCTISRSELGKYEEALSSRGDTKKIRRKVAENTTKQPT